MPAPMPPMSHQKSPPSKPQVRPCESDAAFVSVRRSSHFVAFICFSVFGLGRRPLSPDFVWLEVADADGGVAIKAKDFVEGKDHGGGGGNDGPADDGHFALVHIATPDGETAVDDGRDAEDEAEHHDYGEAVADAGLEVGGTERRALREGGHGIKREQSRGDDELT